MATAEACQLPPASKRQRMASAPASGGSPKFDGVVEQPETPAKPEDYVRRNGMLLVRPYYFDFSFGVKLRHEGRNVIDILCDEFPVASREYYQQAFADGRLRVEKNRKPVHADTPLQTGQLMRHFVHRHEPPVPDADILVLGVTEDVVAVSKPACTPVHVAGQHRKNTVAGRLQAMRPDLGTLLPIHRLDKPVTGVLLFARSPAAAAALQNLIQGGSVEKVYLARVVGVFPEGDMFVDVPLRWNPKDNEAIAEPGAVLAEDPKRSGGDAAPKAAATRFRRLAVAPDRQTSLVECRPITGRSHQIRVHLQCTGHPIANDWQYGGRLGTSAAASISASAAVVDAPEAGGAATSAPAEAQAAGSSEPVAAPERSREAAAAAEAAQLFSGGGQASGGARELPSDRVTHAGGAAVEGSAGPSLAVCGAVVPARAMRSAASVALDSQRASAEFRADEADIDPHCANCPSLIPRGWPIDMAALWLHAHRYGCSEWSFTAPAPDWALEISPPLRGDPVVEG